MQEILVTGGCGFIGRNLTPRLTRSGYKVIVIDNPSSTTSELSPVPTGNEPTEGSENCLSYKADLRNHDLIFKIIKDHDIRCCIHLGAKKSTQDSIQLTKGMMEANVMGTLSVLEACSRCNVDSFIFSSSALVYGNLAKKTPVSEDFPVFPTTVYAASKVAGEVLIHSFKQRFKNCIILRFFNVYGKGQKSSYSGVIPRFIESLRRRSSPIIYGDGFQTRDFTHVNDVVEAIVKAMSLAATKQLDSQDAIFNIGTGIPTSLNELVEVLRNIMGIRSIEPIYRHTSPADVVYSCANIEKARTILGYLSRIRIQEGLTLTI